MNPNDFGRKLGIGVRVAGKIAQQRAEEKARERAQNPPTASAQSSTQANTQPSSTARTRQAVANSQTLTRAAGRGIGGFLRPFGKVGGLLWLEVTGFFFGLFALFFAQDIWRTRLDYASGPLHQRFLIAVVVTIVFTYLSVSAFWRARRK